MTESLLVEFHRPQEGQGYRTRPLSVWWSLRVFIKLSVDWRREIIDLAEKHLER